jgi:outer membrane biogenesis lipoprotein LolB
MPYRAIRLAARAALSCAALGAVLALAGCAAPATPPGPPAAVPGATGDSRIWSGRFSLITAQDGQTGSWSGRYALTRALATDPPSGNALATEPPAGETRPADRWSLELYSPLGSLLARCEWGPGEARITVPVAGGLHTESGTDAQALAYSLLGWPLPLSRFPDWIEGRPSPGVPFSWGERSALATAFSQDGWTVRAEHPAGSPDPHRLDFQYEPAPDAGATPRLRLRLLPGDGA